MVFRTKKVNEELELNKFYFCGKRKGQRGIEAKNKMILFGILERKDKIHTKIIETVSAEILMAEIKTKI